MDRSKMLALTDEFLGAWNTQDIDRVLECYTSDLEYRDPNTRGSIRGPESMRRYLAKLFEGWKMHWSLREAYLFKDGKGCNVLWHATFERPGRTGKIEIEGMDFVAVRDDRISRNEVSFDRTLLVPLLETRADA